MHRLHPAKSILDYVSDQERERGREGGEVEIERGRLIQLQTMGAYDSLGIRLFTNEQCFLRLDSLSLRKQEAERSTRAQTI